MSNAGEKLDNLIRKERLRALFLILAIGLPIVAIFAYVKTPPLGNSSTVTGLVTGLRSIEGDGVRLFLEVRLNSGTEVLVKIPHTGHYYRKGKVVSLNKKESWLFGGSKYYFQHYAPEKT